MTQAQQPREESTFRWLWRFGLVRSVLAIGFIGMTLLQSALGGPARSVRAAVEPR